MGVDDNFECAECHKPQNINNIIRVVDWTSGVCEEPTTQAQPQPDGGVSVISASYHTNLGHLVLAFSGPVTLGDDWQGNITLRGITPDGSVDIILGERTSNRAPSGTGIAWISLWYTDTNQLKGATSLEITIEPGAILDTDGNTNEHDMTIEVVLTS